MGHLGRPRKAGIVRETRPCRHHGLSEHAKYNQGWVCMVCHREDQALRDLLAGKRKAITDPEANEQASVQNRRAPERFCPECYMALPVTGECDNH